MNLWKRIIKKKIAICENHAICSWNESYIGILPGGSIATTICSMLWRNTTRIGTNGKLFMSNPKMGAFISDVIGGEDALIACVRYFGKDMLDCAEDEGRMEEVRKANDEYLSRMARFGELENQMRENLKNSTRCMERFKSEKGMSDEEFEGFLDRVYHLCNHVFMGELNDEVLGLLFKGLYYDRDLSCAEREAEVRGRNERIVFEKRERNGDSLPPLRNGGSFEPDADLSPVFGNRRRRSVWDL